MFNTEVNRGLDDLQLWVAYVNGEYPNKEIKYKRIPQPRKQPLNAEQVKDKVKQLVGDNRPFIKLLVADQTELEDKLRESGFEDINDFINCFSKAI